VSIIDAEPESGASDELILALRFFGAISIVIPLQLECATTDAWKMQGGRCPPTRVLSLQLVGQNHFRTELRSKGVQFAPCCSTVFERLNLETNKKVLISNSYSVEGTSALKSHRLNTGFACLWQW